MEIALTILIAILIIILTYFITRFTFERRFRQWQDQQIVTWQEERKKAIQDAVNQSRAVLGGRFTEQMAPYLPDFRYDPTEARFIGSPFDLIVFPGLAQGDPREIVIIEVKSGKSPQLTPQEAKIRQLVEEGMVRWELLQRPASATSA